MTGYLWALTSAFHFRWYGRDMRVSERASVRLCHPACICVSVSFTMVTSMSSIDPFNFHQLMLRDTPEQPYKPLHFKCHHLQLLDSVKLQLTHTLALITITILLPTLVDTFDSVTH